jgi:DNA-binding XRE family transcriptional regulator
MLKLGSKDGEDCNSSPSRTRQGRVAFLPLAAVKLKCLIPQPLVPEPQTIGDHLKQRRLLLGLSQAAAAQILRVSPLSVLNWERGHRQPVRAATLQRIIRFL